MTSSWKNLLCTKIFVISPLAACLITLIKSPWVCGLSQQVFSRHQIPLRRWYACLALGVPRPPFYTSRQDFRRLRLIPAFSSPYCSSSQLTGGWNQNFRHCLHHAFWPRHSLSRKRTARKLECRLCLIPGFLLRHSTSQLIGGNLSNQDGSQCGRILPCRTAPAKEKIII